MRAIGWFFFLSLAIPAHADRCWMTGGCVGQTGYMYLPHSQRTTAKVFVEPGLPKVDAVAVLNENGFVFSLPEAISDPRFPAALAMAVKENRQLEWEMELPSGAQVKILGYESFTDLKEFQKELFARVLILTEE